MDLLTLKMTLNSQDKIKTGLSNQSHTKWVITFFPSTIVAKSYLTLKLTLNLKHAQTFRAGTHRIWIQHMLIT